MEPTNALSARDVLNRLRAQINAHLPPVTDRNNTLVSESVVPLDRLPMVGSLVLEYIQAEAIYAGANGASGQAGDSEATG